MLKLMGKKNSDFFVYLNLCFLMDFPMRVVWNPMKESMYLCHWRLFILADSADPDEMPSYVIKM